MAFPLRWYQQEAREEVWRSLRQGVQAPLVVLPTGAGKSPLVASLCQDAMQRWQKRVIVLVHTKELIQQLQRTISLFCGDSNVGIMSSGLGQHDTDMPVVVAGVQTAHKRAKSLGQRDLIIVDEAHMIPPTGEGMYRKLLSSLQETRPGARLVGLTATEYRTTSGIIYGDNGPFSDVVYRAEINRLIADGYLAKLVGKHGDTPDTSKLHTRAGEFVPAEANALMSDPEKVALAVREILNYSLGKRGILIFAQSIEHAELVRAALSEYMPCEVVTGETPERQRDALIARFKAMTLRCLINVNVLSTGFDAPQIDLVVMLRPTKSKGLYYQQAGRGFRICDGKANCIILDLAGNIERLGPLDSLSADEEAEAAPLKVCPTCKSFSPISAKSCEDCGYIWPVKLPKERDETDETAKRALGHGIQASDANPLGGIITTHQVTSVRYAVHTKKVPDGKPQTLRVEYYHHARRVATEWICPEHEGTAGRSAARWLAKRLPDCYEIQGRALSKAGPFFCWLTAQSLVGSGVTLDLYQPVSIDVQPGDKFPRIVGYSWPERPERLEA